MAIDSLNHYSSSLNMNVHIYDLLSARLNKAYALTHVALKGHFDACPASVILEYLGVLEDMLDEARNILDLGVR